MVQYCESDFDFVSCVLVVEGVFWCVEEFGEVSVGYCLVLFVDLLCNIVFFEDVSSVVGFGGQGICFYVGGVCEEQDSIQVLVVCCVL